MRRSTYVRLGNVCAAACATTLVVAPACNLQMRRLEGEGETDASEAGQGLRRCGRSRTVGAAACGYRDCTASLAQAPSAEDGRVQQGDDVEEIPYLPSHLESTWAILATSPWNIAFNVTEYLLSGVFADMWDFKQKLCVRVPSPCRTGGVHRGSVIGRRRRSFATRMPSRGASRTTQ